MDNHASLRRKLGIPPNAALTVLDLGKGKVESTTCGWTDTQIHSKPIEEFDAMINSGDMGLASLRKTVRDEEIRVADLRRVRQRKIDLGG